VELNKQASPHRLVINDLFSKLGDRIARRDVAAAVSMIDQIKEKL